MRTAEVLAQIHAGRHRPFASSMAALPRSFQPAAAVGIRTRVHVATTGPEPGNWLVAIEDGACRVFLGSVPQPEARLYTDSGIGHSILNNKLSIDEALASGLLDYDGDPRELSNFRACFQFGDGP